MDPIQQPVHPPLSRLMLFNLATDADDPILGFTTRWIQRLAQHIDHIDVVTMRMGRPDVPDNVHVHSVGKEKGFSEPRRAFEFYRILFRLVHQHQYDACFAHMMPLFAVMAAPILRLKRIPMMLWYTHKSVTWMLRLATFAVDRVVTASSESFRLKTPKVRILGHGIETERFLPSAERPTKHQGFIVLTLGRLSPVKRIDLIIRAIRLLSQNEPLLPVYLHIVGGASTERDRRNVTELERLVDHEGLQEHVTFLGSRPYHEVVPLYQQADCFVNMSETGSVDKAVLEAMSCGLPVIVNPVFTNVLSPDLAALCVIDRDAEKLSERIGRFTHMSHEERRLLGDRLRKIAVRDHDLQTLCGKLLSELYSIMNQK